MQKRILPIVCILLAAAVIWLSFRKGTTPAREAADTNISMVMSELSSIRAELEQYRQNQATGTSPVTLKTNVMSSITSSNISGTTINIAGGNIITHEVVTNLPKNMVFESLMSWPQWLGPDFNNSSNIVFSVPNTDFPAGQVCFVWVETGKPVILLVDESYDVCPDKNDMKKIGRYLIGNDEGCIVCEKDRHKTIQPTSDGKIIHVFSVNEDTPVQLRFMLVKRK